MHILHNAYDNSNPVDVSFLVYMAVATSAKKREMLPCVKRFLCASVAVANVWKCENAEVARSKMLADFLVNFCLSLPTAHR